LLFLCTEPNAAKLQFGGPQQFPLRSEGRRSRESRCCLRDADVLLGTCLYIYQRRCDALEACLLPAIRNDALHQCDLTGEHSFADPMQAPGTRSSEHLP
jgi:hypothetical protein